MTIADKIKATMSAPIDEYFKTRVTNILTKYAETYGIKETDVFEFYFDWDDAYRSPRLVTQHSYDNGKSNEISILLIHIPKSYENRENEINEWILSEGFKRVTGKKYYNKYFCFSL